MDEIIQEVLAGKKYANIAPQVLQRVCNEAAAKYPKKKDAVKAAKTELHIINESYLLSDGHKKARKLIDERDSDGILADKEFALQLLALHASSKERLAEREKISFFLSGYIKKDTVLCDIGCGFSPFALPFYAELPAVLRAYEMNCETVNVLNLYFSKTEKDYVALAVDAVNETPVGHFDVVFLFKVLPVLQQQKKGRAFDILRELDFETAIISFPLKSLSGKEKGMSGHYSSFFENGLPDCFSIEEKMAAESELFYVIRKLSSTNQPHIPQSWGR